MTENKRYVRILDYSEKEVRIFDEHNQKNIFNIFFMGLDSAICLKGALEDTVDLLNELYDENQRWEDLSVEDRTQIERLEEENEQLKQFQDRVFSWIDMHLQRLPTLRDDEFESDNEFADPSLYSGAIQILETMKRELKGDVE